MTVLALDLGTTFGYAFSDGRSGSVHTKADAERYLRFWRWLEANAKGVETIAYEDVKRHIGTRAAHVYGGFKALLETFACEHGIPLRPVPVSHIKKHACGRGNADKEAMILAALKRGWHVTGDDEADALWLLDLILVDKSQRSNSLSASDSFDDRRRSKRGRSRARGEGT